VLWVLALLASAQPAPEHDGFPLESNLRAGFLIGNPLSISIATDLAESLVLQLDLGISPARDTSGVIGMDIVYRAETLFGRIFGDVWLMPWVGFGARGSVGEEDRPDRFGFRVPVGLSFLSEVEPIEVYGQAAVGMSVFPERRASIDAGGGIRVGF
jgi:hypothetical protein